MTKKSKIGQIGEDIACGYLEKKGYKIIERNFRKPWGELDIITKSPDGVLVIVEVKALVKKESVSRETSTDNLVEKGKNVSRETFFNNILKECGFFMQGFTKRNNAADNSARLPHSTVIPEYDESFKNNPAIMRYARQHPKMAWRNLSQLNPEENLTKSKLKKLQRTSYLYANKNSGLVDDNKGWRIDLVAITLYDDKDCNIKHYENI